ncbi:ubiquitin-conjugating enzyme family protein [Striga asiatica]|uniref:NEDD8 carrier protein n=1 Tax=Striga asiatica TaxID=4170 RepID=A0A5A7PXW0_STRAF|nr:ubiquitin-conjugating enzyme family protein [Striga asiatica]
MIKLFKVKQKQRELAESANGKPLGKKQSAGELRLQKVYGILCLAILRSMLCEKNMLGDFLELANTMLMLSIIDITELNLPKTCSISFPNGKDDLMNFEVTIRPDEGYYLGGTFVFSFQISPIYPHDAPKVKCKTKVYHPNIDLEGNVCLNILREDWKPEPNHEDPLNHDAAAVLRDNPKMFESNLCRKFRRLYIVTTRLIFRSSCFENPRVVLIRSNIVYLKKQKAGIYLYAALTLCFYADLFIVHWDLSTFNSFLLENVW